MRGSVYRRKGAKTWTISYENGYEDGHRVRKVEGGFRTKGDGQQALNDRVHRLRRGEDPLPEKITLDGYLDRYLVGHDVRPHTHHRDATLLSMHVRPLVGSVQLSKVKPGHVRLVMDAMKELGLSPATVACAHAVWGGAMQQAVADGLIPYNPVRAVKRPKLARPELAVPDPAQLRALLQQAEGTIWEAPLTLAVATGARRSEVLGLRWSNVDLENGRVTFAGGLHRTTGTPRRLELLPPKTKSGRRTVTLYAEPAEVLRRHRKDYLQRRLALGEAWQDTDAVCDRGDGGWLDPDSFTKAFKKLAAAAGLPVKMRLHDVRHAVATELAHSSIHAVIVSEMLGHQSPAFTASTYQHAWRKGADEAAAALGDRMGAASPAANLQPKN